MKKLLAIALLFLPIMAVAQTTTYTTTQDACSGKANQACYNIPDIDQNGATGYVSIDNRSGSTFPLQYNFYLGPYGTNGMHGTYSGFVANPDGTRAAFYGYASFLSDDGRVEASWHFYATYVSTCSGRACGGTLGWHYRILAGSTVEVQ